MALTVSHSELARRSPAYPRRLFDAVLTPGGVLRVALYGALVVLFTRTFADADLWGHVRFGMDIIRERAIPIADSYSFTSDVPWVNHEWLAEVSMGAAYLVAGNAGLVALKLLVAGFVAAALVTILRRAGWRGRHLDIVLTLALLTTFFRLQYMRPQLFSVGCFTALLLLLGLYTQCRPRVLWAVPPLFVIWVNSHGGFIVGLGVLALWTMFAVAAANHPRERMFLVGAAIGSAAATLVNPYGVGLWRFIRGTVGLNRPEILDWIPLWQFPVGILMLELIFPLVVLAASLRARRVPPARNIAIACSLGLLMLKVSRVDVFFHLSLALLILPYAAMPATAAEPRPAHTAVQRLSYAAVLMLLVGSFLAVAARNLGRVVIDTLVPDREAVLYVRDITGAKRVLTWYNWGQYAIWHLAPNGIKVSMDGRRETVYSDRVVDDHFRFYRGEAAFLDYPRQIGADAIWVPADFPVVPQLLARGWKTGYKSDVSIVLLPAGAEPRQIVGHPDRGDVFPGP